MRTLPSLLIAVVLTVAALVTAAYPAGVRVIRRPNAAVVRPPSAAPAAEPAAPSEDLSQYTRRRDVHASSVAYQGSWLQRANQRIEKHRKGDFTIKVVDARGKPLPRAEVRVFQTRSSFRWGTAIAEWRLLSTDNGNDKKYRQILTQFFNSVVVENNMKWHNQTPYHLDQVDRALSWCEQHYLDVRGHTLLWGMWKWMPPENREMSVPELMRACRSRVIREVRRYAGRVYAWDVVNEAAERNEVWDYLGWRYFPIAFYWARAANADVKLCYNDYGIINTAWGTEQRQRVMQKIRTLINRGAPLDSIGIQAHMYEPRTPIPGVLDALDQAARFGLPLEITEFDYGNPNDVEHGRYFRNFLIACFSHPAVESFTVWGFWQGQMWRAPEGAGMFRRDWSERPAAKVWRELVLNKWRTRERGRADGSGVYRTRAFLGLYKVTALHGDRRGIKWARLDKDGSQITVVIR